MLIRTPPGRRKRRHRSVSPSFFQPVARTSRQWAEQSSMKRKERSGIPMEMPSYIPEVAWNDTSVFKVLSGSGGGASQQFTKPDWQLGTGVPNDGYRDVPDIAFSASPGHDAYLICTTGSCSNGFAPPLTQLYFVGGTSCAAPVFAGMLALLNQSQGSLGNVNPGLYALASFNSNVFHDIVLGNNQVPCVAETPNCTNGILGFSAGLGYDQVTGLGSIDATQLIDQWGSDFQLAVTPPLSSSIRARWEALPFKSHASRTSRET
jgi:subtilase family serine protease